MIRFSRYFVLRLLPILVKERDEKETFGNTLLKLDKYREEFQNHPDGLNTLLADAADYADDIPIEEVVERIATSLSSNQEEHSKLIIDKIAEIIGGPFASSMMSGDTLRGLRRAILNPTEMADLTKLLDERELHCQDCGGTLASGELTCLKMAKRNGRNEPYILCLNCCDATVSSCAMKGCKHRIPIFKKLSNLLAKMKRDHFCESCRDLLKNGKSKEEIISKQRDNQNEVRTEWEGEDAINRPPPVLAGRAARPVFTQMPQREMNARMRITPDMMNQAGVAAAPRPGHTTLRDAMEMDRQRREVEIADRQHETALEAAARRMREVVVGNEELRGLVQTIQTIQPAQPQNWAGRNFITMPIQGGGVTATGVTTGTNRTIPPVEFWMDNEPRRG